jgi:hypothetical protein
VGNFLYGRMGVAAILLAALIASSVVLIGVINRLWAGADAKARESQLTTSNAVVERD